MFQRQIWNLHNIHEKRCVHSLADGSRLFENWSQGDDDKGIQISGSRTTEELTPLQESRAKLLTEWADDDSL